MFVLQLKGSNFLELKVNNKELAQTFVTMLLFPASNKDPVLQTTTLHLLCPMPPTIC
jgi:hypothetical protein